MFKILFNIINLKEHFFFVNFVHITKRYRTNQDVENNNKVIYVCNNEKPYIDYLILH